MNTCSEKTLTVGLYGCNLYRTKEILDAAEQCYPGLLKITAGFDTNRDKVDQIASIYGAKPCYDLLSFQKADFELAIIALPPFLHPAAFAVCAEAGKSVYLEKPVCVDDQGKESLIETMSKHKPICYVGLSNQYIPPFKKALELKRNPEAGQLLSIHHNWLKPGVNPPVNLDNWRHKLEQSGGELNQHCCHVMHYFRLVGGEPQSVNAMAFTSNSYKPNHEEEELTACFRFSNGMGVFNLSQRAHQNIQTGRIDMENQGIAYRWARDSCVKLYTDRPNAAEAVFEWEITSPPNKPEENYTFLQTKDFLDAYLNKRPMPITLTDGIQAYHMVKAIRESYRKRTEVPVPSPVIFPL